MIDIHCSAKNSHIIHSFANIFAENVNHFFRVVRPPACVKFSVKKIIEEIKSKSTFVIPNFQLEKMIKSSKMLYFLQIAYKGTAYHGWQRQSNCLGVQQVLEDSLTKMLRERCILIGCGRTDAGVHASTYFAHLRLDKEPISNWQYKLNRMLPADISVVQIFSVEPSRHAQYDATKRTYHYFIHLDADPFLAAFSSFYELEVVQRAALKQCISAIAEATDFRSFCKQPDKVDHTRCTIFDCKWMIEEGGRKMRFEITANRFLRGMVRLLVGNLLAVLKGNLSAERFIRALAEQEKLPYFNMAYPQGLFLVGVEYPYLLSLK